MRSILLKLSLITIIAFIFADIEIINLNPWQELYRIGVGFFTPDFSKIWDYKIAIINTFAFAIIGVFFAFIFSIPLTFFYKLRIVRLFCSFIRSIHEIFWAFIFLQLVGLNPICGILSIAIPYSGIFAKVFSEIVQESNKNSQMSSPYSTGKISKFLYTLLPEIIQDISYYTKYRLECAIRSSAILGFIGLPTLGFYLETAFREGLYSEASAFLYIFFLIIASLKYIIRSKIVPFLIIGSLLFISFDIHFNWDNVINFFMYEILPWPMRRNGYYNQSYLVEFNFNEILKWFYEIMKNEGLKGVWNTIILTQMGLFLTAIIAYLTFPFATKNLSNKYLIKISRFILILFRTTPEYILAYLFLLLWGPSMLPAILAISIHNGAILAFLNANNADLIKLKFDNLNSKINNLFYEISPKISGQFFAFLFYRWEVIMRESAILGILGIASLGFYIDSAIADDQLDKAMLLILITAILNMIIDKISQLIRKKNRISTQIIIS